MSIFWVAKPGSPFRTGRRWSARTRRCGHASLCPTLPYPALLLPVVTIVAPRRIGRHVSLRHIVGDLAPVAQARIAPTAAAGGAEDQAVARLHRHARRLEKPLLGAVAPHQDRLVDGAGPAAIEPPRRVLGALAIHICQRLAESPIGQFDPEP